MADLVDFKTGEVWEVKRMNQSLKRANALLARYVSGSVHVGRFSHHRHLTPPEKLLTGGLAGQGRTIANNTFTRQWMGNTYVVRYWDIGGGIIRYDYSRITNWQQVKDVTMGVVVVAGVIVIVVLTKSAAAPILVPLLTQ